MKNSAKNEGVIFVSGLITVAILAVSKSPATKIFI